MAENENKAVQDYYADDFSWCYGCGRLNKDGHQFKTRWNGDTTETIYTPCPEHTAVPGFVYGGVLASLVDCHGVGSASLALHRKNGYEPGEGPEPPRLVTASLQVDYRKPTPKGMTLKAVGVPEEIHPKKWQVHVTVYADEATCVKAKVVAAVMPAKMMQT